MSRRQISQGQKCETDSLQPAYRKIDSLAHASNLSIASFMDGDFKPLVPAADTSRLNSGRGRQSIFEPDSGFKPPNDPLTQMSAHPHKVGLVDLMPGMSQLMGQITVVGQEQKPLGIVVETPDGKKAPRDPGDQIKDGRTALGIPPGGNAARGFVEQQADCRFRWRQNPTVNFNSIYFGIGLVTETSRSPVDADPARGNQVFSLTS